ncbi:MAG TPA: hypothetical protein VKR83_14130 [Ktedonobacteraceae bacterium]|nr:hypothetical protein [Ktedonobacteraceae bacterium]
MRKIPDIPSDEYDEHNQPTEPMSAIIMTLHSAPTYPYQNPPETPREYPILPPSPVVGRSERPPGGALPFGENGQPHPVYPHRSSLPQVAGVLFVVVQLILLARVVLFLFAIPESSILVELVYGVGALFAWPFRLILEHLNLPALVGTALVNYLAALIAILAYGVLARILVRFLKALLKSR